MLISMLSADDISQLCDFEYRNKEWFERYVPPRDPRYFSLDDFREVINGLLEEQQQHKLLMFVVYRNNQIVARVNLTSIQGDSAELGYRVCQSAVNKGIATQAVTGVLEHCREVYGIHRVSAVTTENNQASQIVLLKNGFHFTHREKDAYVLNGQSADFVFFQKHLEAVEV